MQPTRVLCPWDFPGKSTGVGCHHLLCAYDIGKVKIGNTSNLMDFSLNFECNGELFQVNENIRISTSYYAKYKLHYDLKYYSRND